MKKILSLFLICVILLTCVACGEKTPDPQGSETGGDVTQAPETTPSDEDPTEAATEPAVNDEYSKHVKILKHNIYVNYKKGRRNEAARSGHRFYRTGEDLALFVYGDSEYSGTVEGVFDLLNDGTVPTRTIGRADAKFVGGENYPLVAEKSEKTKVGSIECIRFTGNTTDENGRVCYAYGYTFVIDNTACMLVGFVFTPEQTDDEIALISTEIDRMMETVRTER